MNNLLLSPVALGILITTVITSVYVFQNMQKARNLMLHPYSFVHRNNYFPILTSGFIHADWSHLLFNMITFFYFGPPLERIFSLPEYGGKYGHVLFLGFYLFCMVLADISTIIRHRNNPQYFSLGASGAISAVLFSFILFYPLQSIYIIFIPVPIPSPLFAVLYIAFSIYASKRNNDFVNHDAHIWGAIAGIVITLILFPQVGHDFLVKVMGALQRFF